MLVSICMIRKNLLPATFAGTNMYLVLPEFHSIKYSFCGLVEHANAALTGSPTASPTCGDTVWVGEPFGTETSSRLV